MTLAAALRKCTDPDCWCNAEEEPEETTDESPELLDQGEAK
jgi:hypothetical protein